MGNFTSRILSNLHLILQQERCSKIMALGLLFEIIWLRTRNVWWALYWQSSIHAIKDTILPNGIGNEWNHTEKPVGMAGSRTGQCVGCLGWRSKAQFYMKVSQPTWLYPHQDKRGRKAGIYLLPAGAALWLLRGKWEKAGKRKSDLTWAGCRHRLCHDPKHGPEMSGSFHSHGARIARFCQSLLPKPFRWR